MMTETTLMGLDPGQVGVDEDFGSFGRVGGWQAKAFEHAGGEGAEGLGGEAGTGIGFGGSGHGSPPDGSLVGSIAGWSALPRAAPRPYEGPVETDRLALVLPGPSAGRWEMSE